MNTTPSNPTLVMKFGGTSVGSIKAMAQAVEIVVNSLAAWPRMVVVVSALSGVTDRLLDSASQALEGDAAPAQRAAEDLTRLHGEMLEALVADPARREETGSEIQRLIAEFSSLCHAIAVLGEATPRAMDAVVSLGERMCVRLMAAALASAGSPAQAVDATDLVITDDTYQSAHPDFEATLRASRMVLLPILDAGSVAVVTGFIGATRAGITTTLGRGGSDYTAAILGAALPSNEVWIWTDVDGVMTTDPRLAPDARSIPELSYREVSELAYFGAKVLHPKTIRPVIEAGIGLRVCNTFNPSHPGTRLVAELGTPQAGVVKAVTAVRGLALITVEGRGMMGVPGMAARTFGAVAATGISVPLITQASSEQSICFAVPFEASGRVIDAIHAAFIHEIVSRDIDRVWASGEVGIITVVGSGMRSTPGVAGRIFTALGGCLVNVIAIAQGSSEVAISLVVSSDEMKPAVLALHDLIIKGL
ncbi:MAG TPA: aspartate kinase [Anaerolineaceae bacterium]